MNADSKLLTYGFLVRPGKFADSDAVYVRVLTRRPGEGYPSNPRSDGEDSLWDAPRITDGLALYNLEIVCWRTDDGKHFIGPVVRFEEARFVDTRLALRMASTLKRIDKIIARDKAVEPGDVLVSVAKAIGATWHAYTTGDQKAQWYRDSEWHFGDIASARDHFRACVAKIKPNVPEMA